MSYQYQIIHKLPLPNEINNIILSFVRENKYYNKQSKYYKNHINNINYYNINNIKQNNIFYKFKNKKNNIFKEIELIMFNNFTIINNNYNYNTIF